MTFCYIEIEKLRLGHGATGPGWGSAIWVVDITLRDPISHRGMVSHYAVRYRAQHPVCIASLPLWYGYNSVV